MPNKWGDPKNGQVGGELSYLFYSGQGAVFFFLLLLHEKQQAGQIFFSSKFGPSDFDFVTSKNKAGHLTNFHKSKKRIFLLSKGLVFDWGKTLVLI